MKTNHRSSRGLAISLATATLCGALMASNFFSTANTAHAATCGRSYYTLNGSVDLDVDLAASIIVDTIYGGGSGSDAISVSDVTFDTCTSTWGLSHSGSVSFETTEAGTIDVDYTVSGSGGFNSGAKTANMLADVQLEMVLVDKGVTCNLLMNDVPLAGGYDASKLTIALEGGYYTSQDTGCTFPVTITSIDAVVGLEGTLTTGRPFLNAFSLNNDAASSGSATVSLNYSATGTPTSYMASESSSFSGASWKTLSGTPSFTLGACNGTTRKVYFKLKNSVGTSNTVVDSIACGAVPTVSFMAINGGASSATSVTAKLDNVVSNTSAMYYMASEKSDFSGATWQTYSTAPAFTLSSGNGTKTVYFKAKNDVGVSAVKADSISLAVVVPTQPCPSFTRNGKVSCPPPQY